MRSGLVHLSFHVPQSTWLHCQFSDSQLCVGHLHWHSGWGTGAQALAVVGTGGCLWGEPRAVLRQTQTVPAGSSPPISGHWELWWLHLQENKAAQQWGVRETWETALSLQVREGRREGGVPVAEQRFPCSPQWRLWWGSLSCGRLWRLHAGASCWLWLVEGAHAGADYLSGLWP